MFLRKINMSSKEYHSFKTLRVTNLHEKPVIGNPLIVKFPTNDAQKGKGFQIQFTNHEERPKVNQKFPIRPPFSLQNGVFGTEESK